ncbi:unnamed protein product, partial [Rotaria magnacalcarata]
NICSHVSTAIVLLFVSCFSLCDGELYSFNVLGMVDRW